LLEKCEAQAAGVVLLKKNSSSNAAAKFAALTDEEKTLSTGSKPAEHFQWLTRHDEFARNNASPQQQAQQALTDAAPELAQLAQPAAQLVALGAPAGANRASDANPAAQLLK
jgi:exonuclease SbcC